MARFAIIGVLLMACSVPLLAHAEIQNSGLWLTWRAATYVPADAAVRPLPVPNSKIIAALDVIENGIPVDISKQTVYWYVNDTLATGGVGLSRVTISVPNALGGDSFTLRASLPDYKGGLGKTIEVPVVNPLVVIRGTNAEGTIENSPFLVWAKPYFFDVNSIDELAVSWKVNGVAPQSYRDPFILNVSLDKDTPTGSAITFDVRITNPAKVLEFATARTAFTFTP